jgi:transglutaminase-like putative cysteine protease
MVRIKNCLLFTILFCLFYICLFGNSTIYAAEYKTTNYSGQNCTIINTITVSNPTNQPMTNVKLQVPLISKTNLGSWQTFVGEELEPNPGSITTNSNGGRDAVYNISYIAAGGSVKIIQRFQITNYAMSSSFNFTNYQYDPSDVARINKKYLQSEAGIESDNANIISYAKTKTAGYTNPYLMAKALFSDINLYLTYDNSISEHSALKALKSGRGNCVDYSYLYIAALRSLGIPARIYTGYLYSPDIHGSSEYINSDGTINLEQLKHNWVEFYVSGMGWVVADPTFTYYTQDSDGNRIKSIDWSRFAEITSNNRLITLYEGEDNASVTYSGSTAPKVTYDSRLSFTYELTDFYDLVGHWAREDVMALCNWYVPVVYGKSDNYFGVNDDITRAELVTMINRVLDYDQKLSSDQLENISFTDVSTDYWAYNEIRKAVSRGYVVGFTDGSFQPNKSVTRAEMAAILNNVANLPNKSGSPFVDLNVNGYKWSIGAIENCYNAGLAEGITSTTFEPAKLLSRGEAAVFINRWIRNS